MIHVAERSYILFDEWDTPERIEEELSIGDEKYDDFIERWNSLKKFYTFQPCPRPRYLLGVMNNYPVFHLHTAFYDQVILQLAEKEHQIHPYISWYEMQWNSIWLCVVTRNDLYNPDIKVFKSRQAFLDFLEI